MGFIWGMTELVIGYFLHMLKAPVTGALLMPVGIICMINVYMTTGSRVSTILTSVIAALFKLVTIFIVPVGSLYLVINPVVAILLEGLIFVIPISLILPKFLDKPASLNLPKFLDKPVSLSLPKFLDKPASLNLPKSLNRAKSLTDSMSQNDKNIHVKINSGSQFLLYLVSYLGFFGLFYASIFFYKICFLSFQILLKGETGAPALGMLSISDNFSFLITETFISVSLILGYLFLRQIRDLKVVLKR